MGFWKWSSLGRGRRGAWAKLLGAFAATGLVLSYAAVVPTEETLPVGSKVTPLALAVVSSSSLPPEVQAQESNTAPNLFDRDTTTEHVVFDVSQVEAVFDSPQDLRAIKIFGAAPYRLTVQADTPGGYQPVAGLENLNLTLLPTGWTTFEVATAVNAARLLFTLTPVSGATATGLRELEIWTTAAPVTVADGAALLARLLGPAPPPQGQIYDAFNSTANPTVGVVTPTDGGADLADNTFNFTLDRDPARFVRAYLTYELFGQAHWVSVRRNINGIMSNTGGTLILQNQQWSTQVERINPAWLNLGSNSIEFRVLSSSFKDAGYTVRNVRMVLEYDSGANMVDRITVNQPDSIGTNPIKALYDGDTATGWKPYPADQPINAVAPSVEFEFRRPTQMDAAAFYLSGPLVGQLQVSVKQNGLWIDFPPEDGAVINAGWNTLFVPATVLLEQRVFEAVKLTFLGGFVSDSEIREFLFIGSGVGGRTDPPKIFVTYPDAGQFHGRRAYFQGFVEPWNNGSGIVDITVGGDWVGHFAGTVTNWISKDQIGLSAQADNDPWSVEVKAVYPNGVTVNRIVELTEQQSQAAPLVGALATSFSDTVKTKGKKTIAHDESKMVFNTGTVATDTTVTITPLDEDNLPALDVGMTNVTKGPRRGYRFLPHGAKFLKKVDLSLPYDKALIPPGHTEDDVKTFYFDETTGRWIELERVGVDKTTKMVNSLTDHFTDMINATVTVPDHPQTVSFNPTSIKDIKAADPGANINLIEIPQPNNTGDARLSYPIEVPPGRAGIQPQLAVQYNSSGGNGWMGLGWDLTPQSISVDTRWGVPRYDMGRPEDIQPGTPLETETYLLNGEMLTPVAHRGELKARADGTTVHNGEIVKIFRTRVEGQFRRIIRHGTSPSTYWWEVIDKDGTRSYFGGSPATNAPDFNSVLSRPPTDTTQPPIGNIFKWNLHEMVDVSGNTMRYHCRVVEVKVPNREPWRQIYLERITYTGSNGLDNGPYEVSFHRGGGRADVMIDGRPGFKTVLDQRLTSIDVRLTTEANSLIRRYAFVYDDNPYGDDRTGTAFNKSLLTAIIQYGDDGVTEFNRHRFEYLDEVREPTSAYNGFTASASWNTGTDSLTKSFLGVDASLSALGGNVGSSRNADAYVGVGPISPGNKGTSGGIKVGSSSSQNDGAVALVDVNGDGLPDKVFDCNQSDRRPSACSQSPFVFRPNKSAPGPASTTTFGEALPLINLPAISFERSKDSFRGGEGFVAGVSAMASSTKSNVTQTAYFTDANGDGLTDIVFNNVVRFNRLVDDVPRFELDSTLTPVPIDQGQPVDADGTLPSFADLQNELVTDHPLMDAVRRWVAPFGGQIEITGDVHMIDATATDPARAAYTTADGVRVAIQHNTQEQKFILLGPTDYTLQPLTPPTVLTVSPGDRIYFRVQSRFDGAYDDVRWDPQIAYMNQPATATDVNQRPLFRYRISEDFIFGGRSGPVRMPFTGTVRLLGELRKDAVTTDDVTLAVYRLSASELNAISDLNRVPDFKTPVLARTLTFDQIDTISLTPGVDDIVVEEGQFLLLLAQVDSPINVAAIQWRPQLVYVEAFSPSAQATDADGNPIDTGTPAGSPLPVLDDQGNFIITIDPVYDVDLYPVNNLTAPQQAFIAPATGTLNVVPRIATAQDDTTTDSTLVVTVKRKGATTSERIGKQVVTITNGVVSAPTFAVSVTQGDELYFDISTRDRGVAGKLTKAAVAVTFGSPNVDPDLLDPVPSAFHRADIAQAFPESYRGWSYVAYNGNDSCEQKKALGDTNPCIEPAIIENKLVLTNATEPSARSVYAAFARAHEFRWVSEDDRWQVKGDALSASRHGLDDITVPVSSAFATAPAVPRISRNSQSAGGGGFYVSVSTASSDSTALLDFLDLNGDRFPDVVSAQNFVQYTRPTGRFEDRKRPVNSGGVRTSTSNGNTIGGAGSLPILPRSGKSENKTDNKQQQNKPENQSPSFSISGSLGQVNNKSTDMLLDMNGDGLADRVTDNNGALSVRLNLGYRFSNHSEPWGAAILSTGRNVNASLSAGFSDIWRGFSGGANVATSRSETLRLISDLNGDGLPDALLNSGGRLKVAFNKGDSFADPVDWSDDRPLGDGRSFNLGAGGSYEIDIPIPLAGIVIVINPAANGGQSASRSESAFQDIDGDGFVDHLSSTHDNAVEVRANRTGRTNLLNKVYRPLGATFEVAYTRDGNTFALPQSRWTMTKVTVNDGHLGEGADTQIKKFEYSNPNYNRVERDFYGYATVVEQHRDTQSPNLDSLFRTITREFRTDSYYTKGLMQREIVHEIKPNLAPLPFTETVNTYVVRDESTGAALANLQSTTATGFPQLTRTDRNFYEGQFPVGAPGKTTFTAHAYDEFGNVIRFTDAGDVDTRDDIDATIEYSTNCAATSYVIKPNRIEVRDGNNTVKRLREATIDCATGNVSQVRQFLAGGATAAVTDLFYFANGNIKTVIGPENKAIQRYRLDYEYDPVVDTHVARITDSFGLSSQATYNFKHGKVVTTTDTNNNQTTNLYDVFGRIDKIIGPYEQSQAVPTIDFEYKPDAAVPHATTRHVDKDANGADKSSGTIDTILFTDGLKRVIQTKKDASVLFPGKTLPDEKVMIVSGQVSFDAFGRTVAQKYPTTELKYSDAVKNGVFNTIPDAVIATTMEYDVLDRNTQTTIPDGTTTTIRYGFNPGRSGSTLQFETLVTDANGQQKKTFRDVRELITSVKELNNTLPIWTSYDYDALKQIIQVKDDKDNVTAIAYDNFGRRTVIRNPDLGRTETVYDLAGNVTRKITANLSAATQAIEYDYDFNRLSAIRYPVNVGNNITYTYGNASAAIAPGNTAGRITKITSQMGIEERLYGRLGETIYEKKTVNTFTSPLKPEVYETRFAFDTFGRLLQLIYPDGELLTYTYDSGGNLLSASGEKAQAASGGNHRYQYLHSLFYDKFEQRALVKQGNGVTTAYTYDAQTRRLNNLTAQKNNGDQFQNLFYAYDNVGNVLSLKNIVGLPRANEYGGPSYQKFVYDDLYRLTTAQGVFPYNSVGTTPDASACAGVPTSHCRVYSLNQGYDSIHNITTKTQADTRYPPGNTNGVVQKKTTYDFAYAYDPSARPHAPIHIGDRAYTYDANGNQTGWTHDRNGTRRTIVWDEENRIQSLFDNGHEKTYKYDDQGNRAIKRGPQGETVYVNQFFTSRPGANGTKHVYAGTTRIASKLMRQNAPNANPAGKTPFEKDLYFYHPDHLGTSNYITDLNGKLYEHLEYFPFGETWVEESTNTQRTPYLFTSKELDEETGLYYYGARYYDPRTSVWQSGDPGLEGFIPKLIQDDDDIFRLERPNELPASGVYASQNLTLYAYGHQNPIKLVDPDGKVPFLAITGGIGAIVGGAAGAIISYQQTGSVSWKAVAGGAVAGGLIGLGSGAGVAYFTTGTVTASTGAVITGATTSLSSLTALYGGAGALANKLHHIFGKTRHNLGDLLARFGGSQERAFVAIQRATETAVRSQGIKEGAVFQVTAKVGAETLTVTGRIVEGAVRISNAYIPPVIP